MNDQKRAQLRRVFRDLVNQYGVDNDFDTPDDILAGYLIDQLVVFGHTVQKRDRMTKMGSNPVAVDKS